MLSCGAVGVREESEGGTRGNMPESLPNGGLAKLGLARAPDSQLNSQVLHLLKNMYPLVFDCSVTTSCSLRASS